MSAERNPRLEQAFLRWLSLQDAQIRDAIVFEPSGHASTFTLTRGAIELKGSIEDRGIDVWVEREGECWDILLSLIVVPEAVEGGYHCLACLQCFRRVFPDVERLWRNHLFGPLLGWMRRRLFRADRLGIYSAPGATWARLLRPSDPDRDPNEVIYAQPD